MITDKVLDLSPEEWEKIMELPKDHGERKAKENELYDFIENNPDNLTALVLGFGFTDDVFMKDKYVQNMMSCARACKDISHYTAGVYACRMGNRLESADELAREMKQEYPLRGRVIDSILKWHVRKYA